MTCRAVRCFALEENSIFCLQLIRPPLDALFRYGCFTIIAAMPGRPRNGNEHAENCYSPKNDPSCPVWGPLRPVGPRDATTC